MMKLESKNVQLKARADRKIDAIRKVGQLLVESGHIEAGYIESMLARENVANTCLGNGIAIPHGLPKDRDLIRRTGVAVIQFPAGVLWNPGETVYLVVGIAARSDEHIEILANLTHLLDDEKLIAKLCQTEDPEEISACLSGPKKAASPAGPVMADFEQYVDLRVPGVHGLHARPATRFVELSKQFAAAIHVRHHDRMADGKSLVSLLKLGAGANAAIRIMARGKDAEIALESLKQAVLQGLEGEPEEEAAPATILLGWEPLVATRSICGLSASPGLAIGPICHLIQRKLVVAATARDPEEEEQRLVQAIATGQSELGQIYQEVKERSGKGRAAIFRAHMEFLNDREMMDESLAHIRKGRSAGWAWQQVIDNRVEAMAALKDPLLSERASDLSDVGVRVLRHLAQAMDERPFLPEKPVILVAEDLTPSDTANLDPAKIMGFCTARGGPTSHTAIIARSLGIPALVGAGPGLLKLAKDTLAILDGSRGALYIDPHPSDIEQARRFMASIGEQRQSEHERRFEPAITKDGHRVEVVANIAKVAEADQAVNTGAEGIGLLRTEFLFLNRSEAPGEEEQYRAYSQMVKALGGLPLVIRTLDIGGDKRLSYLPLSSEDASFMGLRGIRFCLSHPELFMPQLRAIYRAAQHGPVAIMFPMIATLEDLAAAKDMAEQAREEVCVPAVALGVMIEVPSAVAMAEELAREVDFFSIGTNDLTQYTLAMDRLHPMLSKQADALHPAVLRMIARTVKAASAAGIRVGVCGGMAADPAGAVILTGLGVDELSVSIPSVAAIKDRLRNISLADARKLAQKTLACRNAAAVRRLASGMPDTGGTI